MIHQLWRDSPAKPTPDGRRFGLVSFVDILGFAAMTRKVSREELKEKLLYAGQYERSASGNPPSSGGPPRTFVRFQDSLIRCTEIGWAATEAEADSRQHLAKVHIAFIDELSSLRDIQLNFVGEDILIRGAVTLGSYDVVEGCVVGSAYERALDGEKTVAKYPRIVLENSICKFIKMAGKHTHWFPLNVGLDVDDQMFVDYLRGAAYEAPWDLWWYAKALEKHKFAVDKVLRDSVPEVSVAEKLHWLREYHNRTVRLLSNSAPRAWELDWDTFLCSASPTL